MDKKERNVSMHTRRLSTRPSGSGGAKLSMAAPPRSEPTRGRAGTTIHKGQNKAFVSLAF